MRRKLEKQEKAESSVVEEKVTSEEDEFKFDVEYVPETIEHITSADSTAKQFENVFRKFLAGGEDTDKKSDLKSKDAEPEPSSEANEKVLSTMKRIEQQIKEEKERRQAEEAKQEA